MVVVFCHFPRLLCHRVVRGGKYQQVSRNVVDSSSSTESDDIGQVRWEQTAEQGCQVLLHNRFFLTVYFWKKNEVFNKNMTSTHFLFEGLNVFLRQLNVFNSILAAEPFPPSPRSPTIARPAVAAAHTGAVCGLRDAGRPPGRGRSQPRLPRQVRRRGHAPPRHCPSSAECRRRAQRRRLWGDPVFPHTACVFVSGSGSVSE